MGSSVIHEKNGLWLQQHGKKLIELRLTYLNFLYKEGSAREKHSEGTYRKNQSRGFRLEPR